jgi:hypothetical protein
MPRDHANVPIDMWNDDDMRKLSGAAQLLYVQLLSSASLSFAGVADWRPARLAGITRDADRESIGAAMAELIAGPFVVTDDETEEVFLRRFLAEDGLLRVPNVTKAMVTAYNRTVSPVLRGAIVWELRKVHEAHPEWKGFALTEVQALLTKTAIDPRPRPVADEPKGSGKGSGKGSDFDPLLPTTSSLLTTTDNPLRDATVAEFEESWSHWPKRAKKEPAKQEFIRAAADMGAAELKGHVVRFGDAYKATTDPQFVPGLDAWILQKRWTDDLPVSGADTRRPPVDWMNTQRPRVSAGMRALAFADQIEPLEGSKQLFMPLESLEEGM